MTVKTKLGKNKIMEVYPSFIVCRSKDLMVRGGDVYAVWDADNKVWLTDECDIIPLIDREIKKFYDDFKQFNPTAVPLYLKDSENRQIQKWHQFVQKDMRDTYVQLDRQIIFDNDNPKRENYATRHLPYHLEDIETPAYNRLTSVLYSPSELFKIEWCVGAVLSGDSKKIQKFLIITGDAGAGKSTMLNIIQQIFEGYYISFDSKVLVNGNDFGLEQFRSNPMLAIEHDGNLSHVLDNSRLNSLVSHEMITINQKYRSSYEMKFDTFLIIASNLPVEITDAKSGLTRRIIDAEPSGNKVSLSEYVDLTEQIKFELGGIAKHCLDLYSSHKHYFDKYRPEKQIAKTYRFFDFINYAEPEFTKEEIISLDFAWQKYKKYVELSGMKYSFDRLRFKNELMEFFREFYPRKKIKGKDYRNLYIGFIPDRLASHNVIEEDDEIPNWLKMDVVDISSFDRTYFMNKAQLAKADGTPMYKWDNVSTTLSDINPKELHYVKVPIEHIVIDFDIHDENGEKDLVANLKAAAKFPKTYAELSKSGKGVHLHYNYTGDPEELSSIYAPNVEIKVFKGNASLRRKLTLCNSLTVAMISTGLPLKEEKSKVISQESIQDDRHLKNLIYKALRKEIPPGATKTSIDFIKKILDEAYNNGVVYDVSDLYSAIDAFATKSTHNAEYCTKVVQQMKFRSIENEALPAYGCWDKAPILYFDIEVFPNLFIICHKLKGEGTVTKMINPTPDEVEQLFNYRLVGFNNRRYDNHILYAAAVGGYSNQQLFKLSQRIIKGDKDAFSMKAYALSYADVYEYSSKKQSLKKWEIDLGIFHLENQYAWDQPVAEEHWDEIATYCCNDVIATEKVAEACEQDFVAREILSELSGLPVNYTTRQHATKIIFGDDKNPELVYTDLSELFPGYKFENGKSSYMDEDPSEGGYVYAEPGIYEDVALLDVASLHPHSIIELNLFGEHTQKFKDILNARIAIKHHDKEAVANMLDGKLMKFLKTNEDADKLAYALKIVINSVYGYTTAKFDNVFKDPNNVDNIVAKRGSLFMITLKHEVQKLGYIVAHIKTDSIKIPNADEKIINFCMDFGKKYGYSFEHEATYEKMCLVNDAVYVAKYNDGNHKFKLPTGEKIETPWTATGTQFQVPYVFKSLFCDIPIVLNDMSETKQVSSALYLDMDENLPEGEHDYHFIGKIGKFTPVMPGSGGGRLLREISNYYEEVKRGNTDATRFGYATGAKGYRWLETDLVKKNNKEDCIDISYYRELVDKAKDSINEYGDFDNFVK